ncbi:MAG: hypothetical protein IPK91_16025 [Saprospiraceae bacterium]|nr:hypothetical protein [Saprospiraceae bacterium]MBK8298749.1 hypothetical protein [Saprospiraceae bacterium]
MDNENKELKPIQFVRDLSQGKTEEELLEAEQNFRNYLLVVKAICDRLEQEGKDLICIDD